MFRSMGNRVLPKLILVGQMRRWFCEEWGSVDEWLTSTLDVGFITSASRKVGEWQTQAGIDDVFLLVLKCCFWHLYVSAICMSMCSCLHICTCRGQRPEVRGQGGWCLSQLFCVLYFEAGSLTECGVQRLARSGSLVCFFFSGAEDPCLNTGSWPTAPSLTCGSWRSGLRSSC